MNMAEELHRIGGVKAMREWNKAASTLHLLALKVRNRNYNTPAWSEANAMAQSICKLPFVVPKEARRGD